MCSLLEIKLGVVPLFILARPQGLFLLKRERELVWFGSLKKVFNIKYCHNTKCKTEYNEHLLAFKAHQQENHIRKKLRSADNNRIEVKSTFHKKNNIRVTRNILDAYRKCKCYNY